MKNSSFRAHWFSTSHEYRPATETSYARLTLSTGYTDEQQSDAHMTLELDEQQLDALIYNLQQERKLIAKHEQEKREAGLTPFDQYWVCSDCMLDRECEPGASQRTDGRESWSAPIAQGVEFTANFDANNEVDTGVDSFSRSECPVCGTRLGGERYRFAVWIPKGSLVLKVED